MTRASGCPKINVILFLLIILITITLVGQTSGERPMTSKPVARKLLNGGRWQYQSIREALFLSGRTSRATVPEYQSISFYRTTNWSVNAARPTVSNHWTDSYLESDVVGMVPVSVATSTGCENNLHLVSGYSCLVVQNVIEVQLRVAAIPCFYISWKTNSRRWDLRAWKWNFSERCSILTYPFFHIDMSNILVSWFSESGMFW